MNLYPRRPLFNRKPQSNIYRMFLWIIMILALVWMLQQMNKGEIQPLFLATPTPTRSAESHALEGDANFTSGKLDAAILSYEEAVRVDPNDSESWAKLARIQTYSSAFLITNEQKKERLLTALESARKAVELAPDDSTSHAILAFALDWNADPDIYKDDLNQVQKFLVEAEQEANIALQKDNSNTLALAYYAEVLLDQDKWGQAEENIDLALQHPDADQLMDVHRINAYLLETLGQYNLAITEYEKAIEIEPNFTFLYRRAGANYRVLAYDMQLRQGEDAARPIFEKSLEYFDEAAKINERIGVKDSGPYLSIARTYSQLGEYFAAARNVQKALEFDPTNPDIYGQLGIVFFRSRNYEGARDTLKCATYGCSGEDSCKGRGLDKCYTDPSLAPENRENPVDIQPLGLSPNTVVYYYTYGSVLAALSRPRDNKCGEAMQVLGDVRSELDANPDAYADGYQTILSIVQAGEEICASLAEDGTPVSTVPGEAGDVMTEMTATPTP
ncbi:MAG TPA: tetratricopeptide repeat protein [Anaerolineales bacterium]|nr:tetratricopeptide repeat protein [Anaerolineales bacterium]